MKASYIALLAIIAILAVYFISKTNWYQSYAASRLNA